VDSTYYNSTVLNRIPLPTSLPRTKSSFGSICIWPSHSPRGRDPDGSIDDGGYQGDHLIFGFPGAFFLPPTPYFFSIVPTLLSFTSLYNLLTHFAYSDPPSSPFYNVSVKPTHVPCSFTFSSLRRGSPFFSSASVSFSYVSLHSILDATQALYLNMDNKIAKMWSH